MDDLDQVLRQHYRTCDAPTAVRERLLALTADHVRRRQGRQRWLMRSGLAAAALLVLISAWWMTRPAHAGAPEIAESVAAHHVLAQASTVTSPRISDVAAALDRLDFTIRLPTRADLPTWQLLGGRYCSIAGNIAAQLRLRATDGSEHTLYVTRRAGAVAAVPEFSTMIDGIAVRIWAESDLSFAWAGPISDPR